MARLEYGTIDTATDGHGASADILFHLGVTYATGRNGAADLVNAHMWLNLAAHRGNSEAARYRQEIAGEMTAADVATAQRLAREWLTSH